MPCLFKRSDSQRVCVCVCVCMCVFVCERVAPALAVAISIIKKFQHALNLAIVVELFRSSDRILEKTSRVSANQTTFWEASECKIVVHTKKEKKL